MVWYSELARRILPRPTPTPAGDKPPRYIFSFCHRPLVYNSARFDRGEPSPAGLSANSNGWATKSSFRLPEPRIFIVMTNGGPD